MGWGVKGQEDSGLFGMLISSTESLVPSVEGNLVHKLVRIAFFFSFV